MPTGFKTAAEADGPSNGDGTASVPIIVEDPPLSQFATHTLNGGTYVVIYDGDVAVAGTSNTVVLSGFAVHVGDTAKSTWVVIDGQCGPATGIPLLCNPGRLTGGSGDTAGFTGGAGSLTIGPDAFRGADPCPWGPDTCLWDTLTADVTSEVAAGDTSVTATVTSSFASDGGDCLNHIAQVFSIGPITAVADEGYLAAGVGLRNQGSGSINIAGIPAGAKIVQAILYWSILADANPGGAMAINGNSIPGTLIGSDQPSPCWSPTTTFTFRADVSNFVTGNGAYTLSGYPTGAASGLNPWDNSSPAPNMEGASLIVVFQRGKDSTAESPRVVVLDPGHGGSSTVGGSSPNGAVACDGTLEKDLVLQMARRVRDLLPKSRYEMLLTRDADVNIGLAARAQVANGAGADLFMSFHMNASVGDCNGTAERSEAFYAVDQVRSSSIRLAQLTCAVVKRDLNPIAPGRRCLVKKDTQTADEESTVLRTLDVEIPGILFEAAFIDTQDDWTLLQNNFDEFALALVDAIECYEFGERCRP